MTPIEIALCVLLLSAAVVICVSAYFDGKLSTNSAPTTRQNPHEKKSFSGAPISAAILQLNREFRRLEASIQQKLLPIFLTGLAKQIKVDSSSSLKIMDDAIDQPSLAANLIERAWGNYVKLEARGGSVSVKKVLINPKASLSWQRHSGKNTKFFILAGSAAIEEDEGHTIHLMEENESVNIVSGKVHRILNRSQSEALEYFEFQAGDSIGVYDVFHVDESLQNDEAT